MCEREPRVRGRLCTDFHGFGKIGPNDSPRLAQHIGDCNAASVTLLWADSEGRPDVHTQDASAPLHRIHHDAKTSLQGGVFDAVHKLQ